MILLLFLIVFILVNTVAVEHFTLAYRLDYSPKRYVIDDRVNLSQYIRANNLVQANKAIDARIVDALNVVDPVLTVLPHKCMLVIFGAQSAKPLRELFATREIRTNTPMFTKYFLNVYKVDKAFQTYAKGYSEDALYVLYDLPEALKSTLQNVQGYEFFEYEIDIHVLKASLPYVYTENLDLSIVFPTYRSRFPVRRIICIDVLLTAKSTKGFEYELYDLVSSIGEVAKNNYYTQFFEFSPITEQYLRRYNAYLENKSNLPILEQFQETRFDRRYVCYDHPELFTKKLCQENDQQWDRPCIDHKECPFYNATRGGCYDGYCEMPIGVSRKSFRTFDPATKPICKKCPLDDLYCCKNKEYAFELETFAQDELSPLFEKHVYKGTIPTTGFFPLRNAATQARRLQVFLALMTAYDVVHVAIHKEGRQNDQTLVYATSILQKENTDFGFKVYTETLHGSSFDRLLAFSVIERLFDDVIHLSHPHLRSPL